MEWKFIVALIFAIPVILFPLAFLWYVNVGSLVRSLANARQKKAGMVNRPEAIIELGRKIEESYPAESALPVGSPR